MRYCVRADAELRGDLPIRFSRGDEPQHSDLAIRQIPAAQSVRSVPTGALPGPKRNPESLRDPTRHRIERFAVAPDVHRVGLGEAQEFRVRHSLRQP